MKSKRIAAANKIAERVLTSYMVLKVPLGYALVKNAKAIIEQHTGADIEDEDLEEIFARFLDLVVFALVKDTQAGGEMPQPDEFYAVAKEVLDSLKEDEDEDEGDDFADESRFNIAEEPAHGQEGEAAESEDGLEGLEKGRF